MAMRRASCSIKTSRRRRMQFEHLEDRQLLAAITVDTTADNTTLGSTLTLREAIEVSDGTMAVSSLSSQEQAQITGIVGATNSIGFNIPTTDPGYDAATGVWTITVQSALPAITTNAAVIYGYGQAGASQNTLTQGDNAKLTIAINGAGNGTIDGLIIEQGGSKISGLDIENFGGAGVRIAANSGVQIAGNFIGTDPTGEIAAPDGTGVVIESSSNTVGGTNAGDRNLISGNNASSNGDGIYVPDQTENPLNITPTGNLIENNYIGIDAAGTTALGNTEAGVADFGSGDTYGGTSTGVGNVISGNAVGGLKSTGSITIEGNFIGTDAFGNVALGNGPAGFGITNQGTFNAAITSTISDNVVSGNKQSGIAISPGSQSLSTYTIDNNFIGTNSTGTSALGNSGAGLDLESDENATVENNVISGNGEGLQLSGFGTDVEHNVIQGNLIGTDKTGLSALPNTEVGVILASAIGNTIGGSGPGQGNVIAFNEGDAIDIGGGEEDEVSQNSIFGNNGAGIKLSGAANNLMAAPAMTFTPGSGSTGTLAGTLSGSPNTTYTVEIFSNPSVPSPGFDQGKTFIQDVSVTTDGTGNGNFSVTEPLGDYTATATDPNGNTSQFSAAAAPQPLATSSETLTSSVNPSTLGQSVTFTAVVSAPGYSGTPTGTVTFAIDGQTEPPVTLSVVGGVEEAQFTTSALTVGSHTISANYSGDSHVSPSNASLPTQTVTAPPLTSTTTTVSSSSNPSTLGDTVTFTAVVIAMGSPGNPTGTITFVIDGQTESPVSLAVVGGVDEAQFDTTTLGVGSHTVSANYSGDSTFSSSSGSLPSQTVDAPTLQATTTDITSSINPSTLSEVVTFTAVVTAPGYTGTPTGTVTFTIDGHAASPVALAVVGGVDEAQFTTSSLTVERIPSRRRITATLISTPAAARCQLKP